MFDVECVRRVPALLGESPVWSGGEQALYWVDIRGCAIHRFDPSTGRDVQWNLDENVGSIALRKEGGAVIATRSGFHFFDFKSGRSSPIANPIAGQRNVRFNDGRCDRQGRFWSGTVSEDRVPGTAAIFCLDGDLTCTKKVEGLTVVNTIAWSPSGDRMYFGCSHERKIFVCDFDPDDANISNQRVFLAFGEGDGAPDGATVDEDGCLWVAHHDGAKVTRFRPDGDIDRIIRTPVPRPSCPAFGGPDHDILYVTSVCAGLDDRQLREAPLSGGLFAIGVGIRGLPEPQFIG